MNKDTVKQMFYVLSKEFDNNVNTELHYTNNYQLLVAVMLSAQTTDAIVNRTVERLFDIMHNPEDAIKIGKDTINNYIKAINYHNVKSGYIVNMSKQLIDRHNSKVPNNFNDLISLTGVGRKTANLILSIAFKEPRIAVDTHVFRVANRLGMVRATNVLETEKQLATVVPTFLHRQINNLLIPFGRRYCRSIAPKCHICPLQKLCKRRKKFKTEN